MKTLSFDWIKHKWQHRGKRGDGEEALSRYVIHTATYIFQMFPTTDKCAEGGRLYISLPLSNTNVKVFPVRIVRWPNSIMGDWLNPKWAPFFIHTVPLFPAAILPPCPPLTVVSDSLVAMSPSCLWLKKVFWTWQFSLCDLLDYQLLH